jgi:anaerobic C4-dicarboxylate transporter DcuA
MIILQLAIVLICIFIGARMSGIGLGVMGMIGLLLLIFIFKCNRRILRGCAASF